MQAPEQLLWHAQASHSRPLAVTFSSPQMPLWQSHLSSPALLSKWNVTCVRPSTRRIAHVAGKFIEWWWNCWGALTSLQAVDVCVQETHVCYVCIREWFTSRGLLRSMWDKRLLYTSRYGERKARIYSCSHPFFQPLTNSHTFILCSIVSIIYNQVCTCCCTALSSGRENEVKVKRDWFSEARPSTSQTAGWLITPPPLPSAHRWDVRLKVDGEQHGVW